MHLPHQAPSTAREFVVIDLRAPTGSGLILIEKLKLLDRVIEIDPQARVVMLTSNPGIAGSAENIGGRIQRFMVTPAYARVVGLENGSVRETPLSPVPPAGQSLRQVEWEHIQRVLAFHKGNKAAAARTLKIHLSTLKRKLARKTLDN